MCIAKKESALETDEERQKRISSLMIFRPGGCEYRAEIPRDFIRTSDLVEGASQKDFRIVSYGVRYAGRGKNNERGEFSKIYFDTPYNFILMYVSLPLASVGFEIEGNRSSNGRFEDFEDLWGFSKDSPWDETVGESRHLQDGFPSDIIVVKQLQGVPKMRAYLAGVRWERLLLRVVEEWALGAGFREMRVISAEQNKWYRYRTEEQKRVFHIRYDKTPLRLGFKKSPDGMYTFKSLVG